MFLRSGGTATGPDNIRWVIGTRKDAYGVVTGEILSARSTEDTVLDALKEELSAAGYRVVLGNVLPAGVPKGLELGSVQVELNETSELSKVEATGKVKLSLSIWKDGVKVRRLDYQASASDVSVFHSNQLAKETVEKILVEVMKQAVPDIVTGLELKPVKR